jgi:hypothetical protein
MTKWKYLELEVIIGGPISGVKGQIVRFEPNGKHFKKSGDYGSLIAKLGEEGWELVSSSARIETGLTHKHKINYIFKLPIE